MAGKLSFADGEPGTSEADGRRFFEGKAQGVGSASKRAGAERGSGVPVAAEMKLGASEVVEFLHMVSDAEQMADSP